MRKNKFEFGILHFFILIFILFLGITIYSYYSSIQKKSALQMMTSREIALMCTTDMATEYHIHPFLIINILGKKIPIPDNIGIINGCMNSIHTHDEGNGKLHVEAEIQKDFTIGDFFAVWKKEFNKNQILDYKADATHIITMKVNSKIVDTYENTILKEADVLEINYEEIK